MKDEAKEFRQKIKDGTFDFEDMKRATELIAKSTIRDLKAFDSAHYSYKWTAETTLTIFRNGKVEAVLKISEEKEGAKAG